MDGVKVDAEKVRKGFECCYMDKSPKHREGCPYNMDNEGCGHDTFALERDALALILRQQERIVELEAAQTARVMTLEELENALDTVVWVEEPKFENFADHYALIMAYSHKVGFVRVSFGFARCLLIVNMNMRIMARSGAAGHSGPRTINGRR